MSKKLGAASLSIGVNVCLVASKAFVAFITGSIGLYAETAHSFFDLFASVLAYLGIRKAQQPEDPTHHFGHEKFENLSSLLQALLITATALVVIYEAYSKFMNPSAVEFSEAGIALMLVSLPVVYYTSKYLGETASTEGSSALEADSAHFTTDVISSASVLVGLVLVKLGYGFGDPFAALVVGVVMLWMSIGLLKKSFFVFMDFGPGAKTMERIGAVVAEDGRIRNFHKLRARIAGSRLFVEVHIRLPQNTPIRDAHAVAHDVEKRIISKIPEVKEVTVHVEPD
ncbi:MAG: cation diffusion facilitator family transporter [Candidatus Micrarchaeota archaeon]